jgi:hypothetical protein
MNSLAASLLLSESKPSRLDVAGALSKIKQSRPGLSPRSVATTRRWLQSNLDKSGYVPPETMARAMNALSRGPQGVADMRGQNIQRTPTFNSLTARTTLGQMRKPLERKRTVADDFQKRFFKLPEPPTPDPDEVAIRERGLPAVRIDYLKLKIQAKKLEAEVRDLQKEAATARPEKERRLYAQAIAKKRGEVAAKYQRLDELGQKVGMFGLTDAQMKQRTNNALTKLEKGQPLSTADEKLIRWTARQSPKQSTDLTRQLVNNGIHWGDDTFKELGAAWKSDPERHYIPREVWSKLSNIDEQRHKAEAAGDKRKLEQLAYQRRAILKRELGKPESLARLQKQTDEDMERLLSPLEFDARKKREAKQAKDRQQFNTDSTKPGTRAWALTKIANKYAGRIKQEHLELLDWYLEDSHASDTREWLPLLEHRVQTGRYDDIRKLIAKKEAERRKWAATPRLAASNPNARTLSREEQDALLDYEHYKDMDRGDLFNEIVKGPGPGREGRRKYNKDLQYFHDRNIDEIRDQMPFGRSYIGGHIAGLLSKAVESPFDLWSSGAAFAKGARGEPSEGFLQDNADMLQFGVEAATFFTPKNALRGGKWVAGTRAGQFVLKPLARGMAYVDDVAKFNGRRLIGGPHAARATAAIEAAERSGLAARGRTLPGGGAVQSSLGGSVIGQVPTHVNLPGDGRVKFERVPKIWFANGLTPAQRTAQAEAMHRVYEDFDNLYDEYWKKFPGKVIDADKVKELFPTYLKDPGLYANSVHNSSSVAAQLIYERSLSRLKPGQTVAFRAGGPASGKSSTLSLMGDEATLVYDTMMAHPTHNIMHVNRALKQGAKVEIYYVHRPLESAVVGALERSHNGRRRVVPVRSLAQNHLKSQQAFFKTYERYRGNPRVNLTIIDNSGKMGEHTRMSIDALRRQAYTDVEELVRQAERTALREYIDGNINARTYQLATGVKPPKKR